MSLGSTVLNPSASIPDFDGSVRRFGLDEINGGGVHGSGLYLLRRLSQPNPEGLRNTQPNLGIQDQAFFLVNQNVRGIEGL